MAAIIVARRGTAEMRERVVEGRGFFSTCNLFGMQEHEYIVFQAMLFFICFRK